ncbi:hypothetical protein GW17_00027720, partial [Ensete ventricosum]
RKRGPRGRNLLAMTVCSHGEGDKPGPISRPGHQVLKRIVKCPVGFSTAAEARSAPVPVLRRQGEDKGKGCSLSNLTI